MTKQGATALTTPLGRLSEEVLGRLEPGSIGALAARAGMGKTACLVQVGLAALAEQRRVLHVALDLPVRQVRDWYDRLCREASEKGWLDGSEAARLDRERTRHIHSYLQQGFTADRLSGALEFLADVVDFEPHVVLLDGFPFELADRGAVAALGSVVRERGVKLIVTALTHRDDPVDPDTRLPANLAPFEKEMTAVVVLEPSAGGVAHLRAIWSRGGSVDAPLRLQLDPTSLLVQEA